MANCVKCRFSLNLLLFSVVLKSAPEQYRATYCPWDSPQIHSSCTSMSLWWQNSPSLWLLWTVSIPKWVSILWHGASAPSDAKLLEGGVHTYIYTYILTQRFRTGTKVIRRKHIVQPTGFGACSSTCCQWDGEDVPAPWERSNSHPPVRVQKSCVNPFI